MNTLFKKGLIFLLLMIGLSIRLLAQVNSASVKLNYSVHLVQQGANAIAQISVDSMQGHQGKIKIYNSQQVLIKSFSIELIGAPYSASIDVSALQPNRNYIFELITDAGQKVSLPVQL